MDQWCPTLSAFKVPERNLNVQVDTDGLANGVNFATVATLTSYNTIGNIVTTYFEGAEHQLTVT